MGTGALEYVCVVGQAYAGAVPQGKDTSECWGLVITLPELTPGSTPGLAPESVESRARETVLATYRLCRGVCGFGANCDIGILLDVGERETFSNIHLESGSDLLSRAVSSQVPSARGGLTSVFGMGTGGTLQP